MEAKQALADKLKEANNILVTVSNNPSVDQLASCIGLTLALNKMNKHATAVFSGTVPSTIEFLQPEKTIEKNTDSLRDFIISLDKSKADKLRYKVEDKVVKIFITPYKTSISDKDLEFSQGDFNVDAVVALGVHSQNELDQAITAHGRILHDATVTTINVKPSGDLGAINWLEPKASSLSELIAELVIDGLGKDLLDEQMSTALLTGIVAETNRFSNDKTIPATMTLSAELMAAGANQQLVATKLEPPKPAAPPPPPPRQEQPAAPTQVTEHGRPADF
jgi:nanoRNase/pAp phosphatase (c-di-AMP/oligoRNAs hydrolase)